VSHLSAIMTDGAIGPPRSGAPIDLAALGHFPQRGKEHPRPCSPGTVSLCPGTNTKHLAPTPAAWADAATDTVDIARRYADLGVGLADASLVALAARLNTVSIATFDQRHFRAMRPTAGGDAFRLLPLDA
jgi:hypothetical protein